MWNGTDRTPPRRRSVSRLLLNRLLALAGLLLALGAGLFALHFLATAEGPLKERTVVVIERGASLGDIAARLERERVVSSRHLMLAWLLWQRLNGEKRPLRAGEYAFAPGVSVAEVVALLRRGRGLVHRLTIPEGMSVAQVLKKVRDHPALSGDIEYEPEEGSLKPDTWLFTRGERREALLRRMQRAQRRLLAELWEKRAKGLPLKTPREALILASIVEKETGVPEERARIAAVFLNRLRKGMPLQADPTVIYGLARGEPLGRALTKADLKRDTPWNTYLHKGLPPTPIANPGRAAIEAVLHPVKTDDLYFVADGEGRHLFAVSLRAHNRNVARLRRLEKARAASSRPDESKRREKKASSVR